jgi:hypothetical protein
MSVSLSKDRAYPCPCEALASVTCGRHSAVEAAAIRAAAMQRRAAGLPLWPLP